MNVEMLKRIGVEIGEIGSDRLKSIYSLPIEYETNTNESLLREIYTSIPSKFSVFIGS